MEIVECLELILYKKLILNNVTD